MRYLKGFARAVNLFLRDCTYILVPIIIFLMLGYFLAEWAWSFFAWVGKYIGGIL